MYGRDSDYPNLRKSLAPQYAELSDEALDAVVAEVYGAGVTAEDVESFWSDLGKGFKKALPGIAQGALTGASVGGPFGAIAGALAGGAGGILSQSKNPTLRGIGGAVGGVTKLASGLTGGGALGGLANVALGALGKGGGPAGALGGIAGTALGALQGRGGAIGGLGQLAGTLAPQLAGALGAGAPGGSANALLGLFSRPETLRALQAAAMGQFGRASVPIGTQAVPVGSIMSAIGTLAGRAAGEAESAGEALPEYFFDQDGELAVDPADSDSRTNALLTYLALTSPPRVVVVQPPNPERSGDAEYAEAEPEYTEADAEHDEWLTSEAWESAEYEEQDEAYA